jgi:hypothetical protein
VFHKWKATTDEPRWTLILEKALMKSDQVHFSTFTCNKKRVAKRLPGKLVLETT